MGVYYPPLRRGLREEHAGNPAPVRLDVAEYAVVQEERDALAGETEIHPRNGRP